MRALINNTNGYLDSVFTDSKTITLDGKQFVKQIEIKASDLPEAHKQAFLGFIQEFRTAQGSNPWEVKVVFLKKTFKLNEVAGELPVPVVELTLHIQHDIEKLWAKPETMTVDAAPIVALFDYVQSQLLA